ncbi:MAG: type IV pilus twitching motility protein PilT [Fischerella sp.]|nr:type IV pilus twitching motility protein PilT [Fischerella sp.]
MSESQNQLNSTPTADLGIPPLPPPPPTISTQRQSTQTLEISVDRSRNVHPAASPSAMASTPACAHRPGTPPPIPSPARVKSNSLHPTLKQLVQEAYDQGISDIHLGVGEQPRFRNRGEIQTTDYPETDKETFMSWLREVLTESEIHRFEEQLEFDGATQYEFARVRINIFDSLKGYAMVMRLIPLKILTIDQLRLPPVFRDICHYHKGLILVTGPTGSGKSTTMAAMIDYINKEMPKHIITIEDPIEFVHKSQRSLIKQREVGMHTRKFDNALKAALREDPDLILVGEMRDKETVNTALKAAQTGHLVMGTLHTNSAVKTIERILNLYSGDEQDAMRVALSESLVAVIAQGLCRTTDGKRAAFHDILINTDAVKDWIKDGKYDEITELMKQASFDGMITMNQSLFNLYQEGRITEETALEMSPTPNEIAQMLRGRV